MNLLVGSVYIDHPRSEDWYKLQMKHLRKTTDNFKHVVYLNGKNNFYDQSEVLKIDQTPALSGQASHVRGLNMLIDYFNSHLEFDNLLLLDSDCFPIQKCWQADLLSDMNTLEVAAPARYENLDTFAHPCAFFVKRGRISQILKFGDWPQKNIIGFEFKDTSSNVTDFYPLIRSNKINHHPVLCGIYWNCFYHHGAGSRNLLFRLFYSYFNENTNISSLEIDWFNQLKEDSDKFINNISATPFGRTIKCY